MSTMLTLYKDLKEIERIDLPFRGQMVTTEGFGEIVVSAGRFFIDKISAVGRFFNPEMTEYKMKMDPYLKELSNNSKYISKVLALDYSKVSKIPFTIPQGMIVKLDEFVISVSAAAKTLDPLLIPTLNETDTLISKIITSTDTITSNRPFKKKPELEKAIDSCYGYLDKCLDPNSPIDNKQLGDIINSLLVLEQVTPQLLELSSLALFKNTIQADKISKNMKIKIDQLVNMANKTKLTGMTKVVLSELSLEIDQSAKLITLAGTILFMIAQAANLTSNIITKLKEIK